MATLGQTRQRAGRAFATQDTLTGSACDGSQGTRGQRVPHSRDAMRPELSVNGNEFFSLREKEMGLTECLGWPGPWGHRGPGVNRVKDLVTGENMNLSCHGNPPRICPSLTEVPLSSFMINSVKSECKFRPHQQNCSGHYKRSNCPEVPRGAAELGVYPARVPTEGSLCVSVTPPAR